METVAFCEFEPHAQQILKKHWPDVPIYDDVRTLDGKQFRGSVDVVCGGFPCQDLSTAGKRAGFSGERSSLYREMLRIISECRPRFAIFENVTGLLTGEQGRWFAQFLYDLASIGYDAEWHCIEAAYIGAPHRRDRVWVIAYTKELQRNVSVFDGEDISSRPSKLGGVCCQTIMADTVSKRQQRQRKPINSSSSEKETERKTDRAFYGGIGQIWQAEPAVGRVVNGVWSKLHTDRLTRLGNAVVPQIPEAIGRAIINSLD